MKYTPILSSLLVASTLLFNQATFAQTITWKNQHIEVSNQAQKLAVYELSALDTLNALGIQASMVPDSSFPNALSVYNHGKAIKAGTLFEPDVKILANQKPDLIIIGGRSVAKADTVKNIAPVLNLSPDTNNYMQDLQERTHVLANLYGKQNQAQALLNKIATKQAHLKQQTQGKTALMLFTNKGNFMPHAEGERFGYVYDFSGFKSVLPAVAPKDPNAPATPRPQAGSPEAAAAKAKADARLQDAIDAKPDYLIVLDRGAVNTNDYTALTELKKNPILKNTSAKIILVDANAWYLVGAGLNNTEFMLDELIQATR